jgi:hypothetical protein
MGALQPRKVKCSTEVMQVMSFGLERKASLIFLKRSEMKNQFIQLRKFS